jgi:BNR repeat protein
MHIEKKFRNHAITILVLLLTLTSGLYLASRTIPRANAVTSTPATFLNYELAGNPFVTNHSTGVTCPNNDGSCNNTTGEPAIRADKAGNFYSSSENTFIVIGGQAGGTFAWKSSDNGQHFTTLPSPDTISNGKPGVSPSGGDTDMAVAPSKNTNGFYNVYVGSLQSSLANIVVSTSKDGGASWSINPAAASVPVDDREWLAADGATKVCLSYHALPSTDDIIVDCSNDAGFTFTQHASAIDATHFAFLAGVNNQIGNLAIDPSNHLVYQVFSSSKDLNDLLACGNACHTHTVWIAISTDGGKTFTDNIVYNNPNVNIDYGHQFVNVSVDSAGNVYVVYTDDHNLYYSFSKTFGQTWSGPYQINKSPSNTAIFPWASAGTAGGLDVVWYGTPYTNVAQGPTNFPHCATPVAANDPCLAVPWYVFFSQNLQADVPNSSWTQVQASATVHYGDVCEAGANCSSSQNRDLLDDFGVAASPKTGLATIIYTTDQYANTALEPANGQGSRGGCKPAVSNTVDCSHTNVAVQTSGSTINQKHHHFEVDEEDFEETDLSGDGGHSPDFKMRGENTGDTAITSISVQVSGLPVTMTWSNSFPLLPGQVAYAETTSLPLGLALAVGNIYPVSITATLADGTTETQNTNAIYTLGAGLGL